MTIVLRPATKINDAPDFCSPYTLGVMDAQENQSCVPEIYYTKRGQMCEYCEGYEAVAGETLTTRQILGKPQPLTVEQMEVEAEELEDDMLDREFWSRGQW